MRAVLMSAFGPKQTCAHSGAMSAFDPKRPWQCGYEAVAPPVAFESQRQTHCSRSMGPLRSWELSAGDTPWHESIAGWRRSSLSMPLDRLG
jgi:hypothetical protein